METRKILAILVLALGLMMCQAKVSEAGPMGTAFTYQGHLYDANHVADGLYDFQFKLYDANSGGSQIGSDVNIADEDVIDALFTVELDFGSSVFDGNAVWLEIGVRPGEMNDPNVYTTLSPRQEITPTPHAIYAKTDNDWMVSGNDMYAIPSGNIGIGTTTPEVKLQVGDTSVGHDVYIAGSTSSQSGLFFYDGAIPGGMRYNFNTDDLSIFTAGTTNLMIDSSGKVGIGTTSPAVKLQVGDTDVGHDVYIAGSTNSQSGLFFYDGAIPGGMRYNFNTDDLSIFTAGTTRLMIDSSGNVCIGTTDFLDEKLEVDGKIQLLGGNYTSTISNAGAALLIESSYPGVQSAFRLLPYEDDIWFQNTNSAGDIQFSGNLGSNLTGDIIFKTTGNVGIGTTEPSRTLDVNGVARIREFYTSGAAYDVQVQSDGDLVKVSSSRKYKTDITGLKVDSEEVLRLSPVQFRWKETGEQDIGLIAEEVEELVKDLVIYDDKGRPDAVKYDRVALYLLEVVKAQEEKIATLEERIAALERASQRDEFAEAKEVQQ